MHSALRQGSQRAMGSVFRNPNVSAFSGLAGILIHVSCASSLQVLEAEICVRLLETSFGDLSV